MSNPPKSSDPYRFDPAFERAVVTMACNRPRFFGRIAHELDASCLAAAPAKLALEACQQIGRELGRGPESLLLVLQRLRRWVEDGKITLEQVIAVNDFFDDAEDAGLPDEESVTAELKPILARRIRSHAVRVAIEESKDDDKNFEKTIELVSKASRLGEVDTSIGIKLGVGSYEEIEKLKHLERLPTGIMELDHKLDGGLRRGSLGVLLGGPGDGKSMGLSHIAASCLRMGLFVGLATLEVTPEDTLARVKANLSGYPINAILEDPECVRSRIEQMALGTLIVQHFTPQATTFDDVRAWVELIEEREGRKLDVLITDYGDKLNAPKTSKSKDGDTSGYTQGRVVFEAMRLYADEGHKGGRIWHWTASQATRSKDNKRKRLDLNDMADSMHKARVADLVVTLNANEEDGTMTFFVAKNRHGIGKVPVGPLPTDFAIGRIAPIT